MSRKTSLIKQITRSAQIIMPLIFSSLNRIETISQAMELRRFGKKNRKHGTDINHLQKKILSLWR